MVLYLITYIALIRGFMSASLIYLFEIVETIIKFNLNEARLLIFNYLWHWLGVLGIP